MLEISQNNLKYSEADIADINAIERKSGKVSKIYNNGLIISYNGDNSIVDWFISNGNFKGESWMGGFFLVVEFHGGVSGNNRAAQFDKITMVVSHFCLILIIPPTALLTPPPLRLPICAN